MMTDPKRRYFWPHPVFLADYRFTTSTGLFPSVFNIAEGADIFVNATCGGGGIGRTKSGDSSEARGILDVHVLE